MAHFVGLDVSVKETAVCVVDEVGEVVLEQKVPTEPDDIVTLLTSIGETMSGSGSKPVRFRNGRSTVWLPPGYRLSASRLGTCKRDISPDLA
jgi:hypothetical protein